MNLQSYFESCLFKRKNLTLFLSCPVHISQVRTPALCTQHTQRYISVPHTRSALASLEPSFPLARGMFSSITVSFPLSRYPGRSSSRGKALPVTISDTCASATHAGTAGAIPEEEGTLQTFCPFSVFTHRLRLFIILLPAIPKSAPLTP